MNYEIYELLKNNYQELKNNYCKYQDNKKLIDAKTSEDLFDDKILYFLESNIKNPTLIILQYFLKTKRNEINISIPSNKCIEYSESSFYSGNDNKYYYKKIENELEYNKDEEPIEDKIQYLFVNYRPDKKTNKNK